MRSDITKQIEYNMRCAVKKSLANIVEEETERAKNSLVGKVAKEAENIAVEIMKNVDFSADNETMTITVKINKIKEDKIGKKA